jgi:integrase
VPARAEDKTLPPGIDRRPSGLYRARLRCDGCPRHGKPSFHSQSFAKLADAKKWRTEQQAALHRGAFVDPTAGKQTFQAFATEWLARQSFDESTRQAVELRLRLHAFPRLGALELRAVKPSTLQAWQKSLADLAPSYARVIGVNVSTVFSAAVDDGLLPRNPCATASVRGSRRKVEARKVVPWPAGTVLAVRDALPDKWQAVVTVAAGLGLRQGEVFGLSPADVDWLRGSVEVRRQVKLFANGQQVFALPKGGKVRTVPLPASVKDALAAHLAAAPAREVELPSKTPDGKPETVALCFTTREATALNRNYWNAKVWKPALITAGVAPTRDNGMHALRHFYASALLDGGESIRALAEYLGHTDPGFTLRVYTHLMPASDERTRKAIDAALLGTAASVPAVSQPAATQA